jgi:non-lysosomal glucosylceramidase
MECFDYPYYATLDVRFYGSMPLVKFWPDIDKQVLREFAKTVPEDSSDKYIWQWKSEQTNELALRTRKARGSVPHDLGVPEEDPIFQSNQFSWQNTTDWKDLNTKFVLMIWRDYVFSGKKDTAFLRDTWPAVQESLEYLRKYDHDGDGIPENDGLSRSDLRRLGGAWCQRLLRRTLAGRASSGGRNCTHARRQFGCRKEQRTLRPQPG